MAVVPFVTETFVMAVTALFVSQLPEEVLRWLGAIGGLFVIYLAKRLWDQGRAEGGVDADPEGGARSVLQAATLAVASPVPWVFWFLVGSPLLLTAWREGWVQAALFMGSFLVSLVGVHVAVAALAGKGHEHLSSRWQRRLLTGTSVILLLAGGVLLWRTATGDFGATTPDSEQLESVIPDSVG